MNIRRGLFGIRGWLSWVPMSALVAGILVTAGVFWQARKAELESFSLRFEHNAWTSSELVVGKLNECLLSVQAMARIGETAGPFDRHAFQAFTAPYLSKRGGLNSIHWIPVVPLAERARFEGMTREAGIAGFQLHGSPRAESVVPGGAREYLYPTVFVEPMAGHGARAGFDLGSDAAHLAALEKARDEGVPIVSGQVRLAEDSDPDPSILLFHPVFRKGLPAGTVAQRRAAIRGFVLGVFRTGDTLAAVLGRDAQSDLRLELSDLRAAPGHQVLHRREARPPRGLLPFHRFLLPPAPAFQRKFPFAGRVWNVSVQATTGFVANHHHVAYWLLIPAGLATSAGVAFTLVLLAQRKEAQQRIQETLDLNQKMVTAAPMGILVYHGATGRCALANEAARGMFGGTMEEVWNQDFREVQVWQESGLLEAAEKTLETGLDQRLEAHLQKPLGKTSWFIASLSLFILEGAPHLLFMVQDTTERKRLESELLETSRKAGMAEVAASVLHNAGNVLTSVNISADLLHEGLRVSRIAGLQKAVGLIEAHRAGLGDFLERDPQGALIPAYLAAISETLLKEREGLLAEAERLARNLGHLKNIIRTQQDFASNRGVEETFSIRDMLEDALEISFKGRTQDQNSIQIDRDYSGSPPARLNKHKVMQIMVNLLQNARQALWKSARADKRLLIRLEMLRADWVRIQVADNGVGVPGESLAKIFELGFTTTEGGHGFGLHASAIAAMEMGGSLVCHSEGHGLGATFTLELPFGTRVME